MYSNKPMIPSLGRWLSPGQHVIWDHFQLQHLFLYSWRRVYSRHHSMFVVRFGFGCCRGAAMDHSKNSAQPTSPLQAGSDARLNIPIVQSLIWQPSRPYQLKAQPLRFVQRDRSGAFRGFAFASQPPRCISSIRSLSSRLREISTQDGFFGSVGAHEHC
jgi:hypothetical protein